MSGFLFWVAQPAGCDDLSLLRGAAGRGEPLVDLRYGTEAAGRSLVEGALLSLNAGVDALLVSGMILPERDIPGLVESLALAIRQGRLPEARAEAARGKILSLKKRYLDGKWHRSPREARALLRCRRHLDLLEEVEEQISKEGNDAQ